MKKTSEDYVAPAPRTQERGLGSSFAYAVAEAMYQAKHIKGSKNGFLGKEKVVLNPHDCIGGNMLYKGKNS